jgi:Rrf2 family nitric oxide-sensitive transcriptional repressor
MRLTVQSDYALRVLMYLGIHAGRLTTIEEIARAYGISQNHLMKIVNRLATHGFVETLRGRGGGLRLARAAESITLGEVLRIIEDDFDLVGCFNSDDFCRISKICRLKRALQRALDAYLSELDSWTLADIISNRKAILDELQPIPT